MFYSGSITCSSQSQPCFFAAGLCPQDDMYLFLIRHCTHRYQFFSTPQMIFSQKEDCLIKHFTINKRHTLLNLCLLYLKQLISINFAMSIYWWLSTAKIPLLSIFFQFCTTLEYRGKAILLTLKYSLNDAQKSQSKVQTR
jgi:hypothetical protein